MKLRIVAPLVAVGLGIAAGLTFLSKHPVYRATVPIPSVTASKLVTLPDKLDGQAVTATAISHNGKVALVTADGQILTYGLPGSVAPGLHLGPHIAERSTELLAFSGDGSQVAGVTTTGAIWEWNLKTYSIWIGHATVIEPGLPFTESASLALNTSGTMLAIDNIGTPYVYIENGRFLSPWHVSFTIHQNYWMFPTPVFSNNGKFFAESGDQGIDVWSVRTGARHRLDPACPCGYAAISSDWSVAAISRENYIETRNLMTNKILGEWRTAASPVEGMAVSADGSKVAWASGSDSVQVATLRGDVKPARFKAPVVPEVNLEFAAAGRLLLVSPYQVSPYQGKATVWQIGA